jgi:RNA methyltransferase, TrmH family
VAVEPTPLSANNPRLAALRRLTGRRKARLDAGQFVIEGPVALAEALGAGLFVDELYVDARTWVEAFTRSGDDDPFVLLVDLAATSGASVWSLTDGVIASVSDTVTPQGLLAVAPRRTRTISEVAAAEGPVLVLVDIADPGNAGTLVRAAEAAGAAGVVFAGSSTDAFGPKAVRAAAGSLLRLPVAEVADIDTCLVELRRSGRTLVATIAAGGVAPESLDLTGPIAVLIGSEAHGLLREIVASSDLHLTIPLAPSVESLNAGVAGAIVLFEASRQRRAR